MSLKTVIYEFQLHLRQRRAARSAGPRRAIQIDIATFSPKKVLFVLSGLIGDSVMSIATIQAARGLWPKAQISVLGKRHNRELIAACGFFDEFYECNADPFSLRRSSEIEKLNLWLNDEGFDAAFILLGDQFAHLLARAGIPIRVGVKGTRLESCLTHTYDIGSPRAWGVNERLGAIRCLGYDIVNALPELCVELETRDATRSKLEELGLRNGENYIVLHPFGSTRRQWWSLDRAIHLAEATKNAATVVVGGETTALPERSEVGGKIINATGQFTLPQLVALIDGSMLVVTTDSGPYHIAGALGKPIVGLFRSRRPEHAKQYPTSAVVFGKNEECMKSCEWDVCRSVPCRQMSDITADDVACAVEEQLAAV